MLTKYTPKNREQVEMLTLDQLVPENHLFRKVEAAIDFSFIYSLVEDAYSAERGRPSIDPVFLIKMTFIQYMFGIRSRRKETIERVFADAKEKHGMRWTTLRGLKKLSMQAMLTFAAINLKKLANWTWKSPKMA